MARAHAGPLLSAWRARRRAWQPARRVAMLLLHAMGIGAVSLLVAAIGFDLSREVERELARAGDVLLAVAALAAVLRIASARDPILHVRRNRAHLLLACVIALREAAVAGGLGVGLRGLLSPAGPRMLLLSLVALLEVWGFIVPSRGGSSGKQSGTVVLSSARPLHMMLASFPAAALAGALLLMLPRSRAPGAAPITFLDAFFTSTSAVCVTGLTVRDTGSDFSVVGQSILLVLIQLGGLGIMTFAAFFAVLLGRGSDVGERAAIGDIVSSQAMGQVVRLIWFIVGTTVLWEVLGALLLLGAPGPAGNAEWPERLRVSLFLSVSAFCNAGFALAPTSLEAYSGRPPLLVVGGLIIAGGIGFPVQYELAGRLWRRLKRTLRRPAFAPITNRSIGVPVAPLSLHARMALGVSAVLLTVGAAALLLLESVGPAPRLGPLDALFLSASARTAGFQTVPIGQLSMASLLVLMALMFVGASPGGTGGGIRTTTLAVIGGAVRAMWRRREIVDLAYRTVPVTVVRTAFVLLSAGIAIVFAGTLLLVAAYPWLPFEGILFEIVSAYGTVGLSTGITGALGAFGRAVLCLVMFLGRLGPLSILVVVSRRQSTLRYRYAEEPVKLA